MTACRPARFLRQVLDRLLADNVPLGIPHRTGITAGLKRIIFSTSRFLPLRGATSEN